MKNPTTSVLILACLVLMCATTVKGIQPFSVSRILQRKDERQRRQQSQEEPGLGMHQQQQHVVGGVQELFLDQRLDHFGSHPGHGPLTYRQRYFYSTIYINNVTKTETAEGYHLRGNADDDDDTGGSVYISSDSDGVPPTYVFLCVGGEGPSMDTTVLTDSQHCSGDMLETAKILHNEKNANVHLFALEHRYYGKSYPTFPDGSSPLTNENLVYLSSRQALADIAHFVEYVQETYLDASTSDGRNGDVHLHGSLHMTIPVVTFGGSYPGVLAAWSRLKYPHLVYAAVSNSAPLEVILDFPQYKDVVARDLANDMVGGSQKCLDVIQKAHEEIANVIYGGDDDDTRSDDDDGNENLERIASMFQICDGTKDLLDQKSVRSFLGDGVVFIDIQSNDPSCDSDLCNIEKYCNFVTLESSRYDASPMEVVGKLSRKILGNDCMNISWEDMIQQLSDTGLDAMEGGDRSWLWQTCTEMGFYQTCERNSTCPFGKGYHTLDLDLEICERAFGIDAALVKENVEDTLNQYGGWNIESSRILSVNGDVDPWSSMSYSNSGRADDGGSNDNHMDSYWSIGASHHFWTHKVKDSDSLGIMKTRHFIYNWVIEMLDEFDSESNKNANIVSTA